MKSYSGRVDNPQLSAASDAASIDEILGFTFEDGDDCTINQKFETSSFCVTG
jgi:hypothetical protein